MALSLVRIPHFSNLLKAFLGIFSGGSVTDKIIDLDLKVHALVDELEDYGRSLSPSQKNDLRVQCMALTRQHRFKREQINHLERIFSRMKSKLGVRLPEYKLIEKAFYQSSNR